MIEFYIDGLVYNVEFRHVRKDGPRPALGRHSPITAITTCVIIVTKLTGEPPMVADEIQFTAIGNAVCANGDAFSRRRGRQLAFYKAVMQCGALRAQRTALLAAYASHDPDPCVAIRPQLTQAEKAERWQAGWEKRKEREGKAAAK